MPVRLVSQERLPPPLEGYVLLERLGRGGFGEVWKAEAPGGLLKAIKFVFGDLDAQDDEHTRAAEQERKALDRVKGIRHPYVLSLERYDILDGQLIIVMELADRNLWDRFRECRGLGLPGVPRDELLKYMDEAAEALDLMNNHYHIQHLDVKPQNLFLVFNHVKVADFGLAKAFEGIRGTVTGGVTPVYAGPETFEGYVSRYTDQYSLAIVFQELLTGTRPFNGVNTKQLLMQHLNGTPDLEALPPSDRPILMRALAKKPDQRWPSCSDLIRSLRLAGSAPVATGGTAPPSGSSVIATRMGGADPRIRTPAPAPAWQPPAQPSEYVPPFGRVSAPTANPPYNGQGGAAALNTPLPALVTPRLVTPQAAAAGMPTPANTLPRPMVVETARMGTLGLAPPERTGDGVLYPALIVAVGRIGFLAVQKLKAAIRERFGGIDAIPHVRFLYIDTDPESTTAAIDPSDPTSAQHVVLARLNRPHHYLQRDGMPPVEAWMPPGQLYRLPRNPGAAAGVRAFGRLALVDNYKTIAQRIRQELESFVSDDPLDKAAERTRLGVRTNRARVYLLAGLTGGTGSGMFIDLAFILKHELRQIGYMKPEVTGMLFVPSSDRSTTRATSVANAYAAVTELVHFHEGRNKYQVRFDPKEPPINDADGPFSRVAIVQLSKRGEAKDHARTAGLAARGIFLELFTPAGRTLDAIRSEAAAELNQDHVPMVQAFGLYRLSWPRSEILTVATRMFAHRLLQRWSGKEGSHLREPIQNWLAEQWRGRNLELEAIVGQFEASVRESLKEDPEKVFDAFIDPLRSRGPGVPRMEAEAVCTVFDQLLDVVGKPEVEKDRRGSLEEVLVAKYKQLMAANEKHLATMSVWFVEQPQYRLAGTEEALSQIQDRLKRTIDGLVGVRSTLDREVLEAYSRLFSLIGGMGLLPVRQAKAAAEVIEALRQYPRKRLKLAILEQTLSLYRVMLASTPEYIREVGFCRNKLADFANAVGSGIQIATEGAGPGRMILPQGVEGLDGASDLFIAALDSDDVLGFDQKLQQEIVKKFKALVTVCVRPENATRFRELLLSECRQFLESRLEAADPAAMFFRYRQDVAQGTKMLTKAFEAACPELVGVSGRTQIEASILAGPVGPDGDNLRDLAEATLPGVQFIPAPLPDDIVFVREFPLFPLAELPQLGPHAREAYDAQMQADQSPHTRADLVWAAPVATVSGLG